jgi:hypothetical protein
MYECANGKRERERDYENLGARIAAIKVMVGNMRAFEVLGVKWSFQEVPGVYLEFTECLGALVQKDRGICKNWTIYKGMSEVLGGEG